MKQSQTKILQVGVKSLLLGKSNKVLILKRSSVKCGGIKQDDVWDIPGGRINAGSSLASNLEREVFEETGIKRLKIIGLLGAQDIFHNEKHIVRLTYISRVTSDNVSLSEEHSEYKWVDIDEVLRISNIDQHLKAILKDKEVMSFIKDTLK